LVVGWAVAQRAVLPEAGNGAVHDARIDALELFPSEAQPVHDPGAEVLQDDVVFGEQLGEDLLAGLRFQVQRQGTLGAVLRQERYAQVPLAQRRARPQLASQVAAGLSFDLEYFGTHERQLISRKWS